MKKLLIFIFINILFLGCSVSNSLVYVGEEQKETSEVVVTILDQRSLSFDKKNNLPFSEISDLSYNEKDHKLYMLGDKGNFYLFSAQFGKKIESLSYLSAFKVREANPRTYDSEGLTQNDKGQLIVSFEGVPSISNISKNGYLGKKYNLPKKLQNSKNYRSKNKMLEAVTWHPKYGILTAAEFPLFKQTQHQQSIYSLKGRVWNFQTEKHENAAITAIEVMDDGNLLILERAYSGLSQPFVITLKKLYLDNCNKKNICKTKVLASYNSYNGWAVNNYEGLTKVGKNRYLMVSDNNNRSFLKTVLVYFEVNE